MTPVKALVTEHRCTGLGPFPPPLSSVSNLLPLPTAVQWGRHKGLKGLGMVVWLGVGRKEPRVWSAWEGLL